MIVVVMGVSGCGKSTVGKELAKLLSAGFAEGDSYHPESNVAKMSRGEPLNDEDRAPWLQRMADDIARWRAEGRSMVLACSALKSRYRAVLRQGDPDLRFVFLNGDRDLIASRILARQGHYMPLSLLDSQFAALEKPSCAIAIAIDQPVLVAAEAAFAALHSR